MKRFFTIMALLAVGGCAQELAPPLNSAPVTNAADYFWNAGTDEAFNSDQIAARDSNGILLVNDSNPSGKLRTTLICQISPDSVVVERIVDSSIFDLDKGTELVVGDTGVNDQRHSGGGLVLFRSNLLADSSWRAGTIARSSKPFAIEGRLLARLDTLTIGSRSYSDVLAIRYAKEVPGFYADSTDIPYWVVFYARGLGPVMFDKVEGSSFERRALLP